MQHFRKISAILLSALVLLSSTSFTFGMHFCMGQLQSIAFFSEAEPCEMATQKSPCANDKHDPDCEHQQVTKKGCCEDHTLILEGSEELSIVKSVSAPDFQMTAVLYALVSFIFISPSVDYYSFK
ncbi:HYC_CC_PP family protein [Algoriphagus sp.]|uniref:HYC_CC_PP family protein n=1 Tax=Algoriphagus sp. TaxID=1872435 RepID=UPI003F722527